MAYAKAYARSAQSAYQQAIDREVRAGTYLGSGLIGLGGIIAALAAFQASRDAIVGTALAGGTLYALGNWSLSKQRQLVYVAGREAIICAVKAVTPFDMPEADRRSLNDSLAQLEQRLDDVTLAIKNVQTRQAAVPRYSSTELLHVEADETVAQARAVSASSREVLVGGRQIAAKVYTAGGELVIAVDRIGAAVDKAVLDTIPDLASVTKVVGGLAGFAGALAPGSSVESMIAKGFKDVGAKKDSTAKTEGRRLAARAVPAATQELTNAIDDLVVKTEQLASEAARVRGRTVAFDPAATTAGLSECGVNVSTVMTATPSAVEMKGGVDETYTVVLGGGTPPYVPQLQGAGPNSGLTVKPPAPYDKAMLIQGTATLAKGQAFSVLVMDASNPPKAISIPITVSGTPSTPGGNKPSELTVANPLIGRLTKLKDVEFDVNGTRVALALPVEDLGQGRVRVNIVCKSKPETPLSQDSVVSALLQQEVDNSKIEADVTVEGGDPKEKFEIAGAADCVAPRTQGRRLQSSRMLATDVRAVQRRLCLPPFLVDGKWGPITQAALDNWRGKNGISTRGTSPSFDERERILGADAATAARWCTA